jgi:hypothetical protein
MVLKRSISLCLSQERCGIKKEKPERKEIRIAIQADGGKWEPLKTQFKAPFMVQLGLAGGRWPKMVGRTAEDL